MSNQTVISEGPAIHEINSQRTNARFEIIQVLGLNNHGEETVTSVIYMSDSEPEDTYEEEEDGRVNNNPACLHQKSLENLEKVRIQESTTCSICLEEISSTEEEEAVRMPEPCSHVYHQNCILKWLAKHDTCPLCRYQIPS